MMKKNNEQVKEESFLLNESDAPVVMPLITQQNISAVYEKPVLVCYGDVRDITLGPSPGFGESGAGVFVLQV